MTNEEKSREIAVKNYLIYLANGGTYEITSESECYQSAMEMAKWKEGQIIEKLKIYIKEHINEFLYYDCFENVVFDACGLLEDFKKAMEE